MAKENPTSSEPINFECEAIITAIKDMGNPINVAGMACFGIKPEGALGVSIEQMDV